MLAKITNTNKYDYKEKWRGTDIFIPAGGSITMDFYDASLFLGTKPPNIEVDGNGIQKPQSYKMLDMVKINPNDVQLESIKFQCQACAKTFATKSAMDAHSAEAHLEAMVDEKAVEEIVKKRGKPGPKPKGVMNDTSGNRNSGEA